MEQVSAHPRVLIVERDQAIGGLLESVFLSERYRVQLVSTLEAAESWLDEQPVDLVLTDSFSAHPTLALEAPEELRRHAYPVPVGVLTGWKLPPEEVKARGFAFLLGKPFDLSTLLAAAAAALSPVWSAEQRLQVGVVEQFIHLLNARAWERLPLFCLEQVRYIMPAFLLKPRAVQGIEAFRAHMEESFSLYQNSRYDEVRCYPAPEGIAARFIWHWNSPDGTAHHLASSELFYFTERHIAQIGSQSSARQLRALLERRISAKAS